MDIALLSGHIPLDRHANESSPIGFNLIYTVDDGATVSPIALHSSTMMQHVGQAFTTMPETVGINFPSSLNPKKLL